MGQDLMSSSTPWVALRRFTPADTTSDQIILAASERNRRIDRIFLTSADTADLSFNLTFDDGTVVAHLCNVVLLANTGYGIPLPNDVFAHSFPNVVDGLVFPSGLVLKGNLYVAITAAKYVDVLVFGGYI